MNSEYLFAQALGMINPWKVVKIEFKKEEESRLKELYIYVDFDKGSKFKDDSGNECNVHDTVEKTWRHLNFFEHRCYIVGRIPRIKTKSNKVKLVETPWSRAGSGFTLMFEAYVMALIENEMPMNKIGEIVKENAHRLWTIFNFWIKKAYIADEPSTPNKIGIDETSSKKGHEYITLAVNLDERRVIHVTEGKSKESVKNIKNYLKAKDVDISKVKHVSMDMSPSFISGVTEYFLNAQIHFDRFHVMKLLNEAMNSVRQEERKEHNELKGHKYTFLKNKENLSDKKKKELNDMIDLYPKLGKAYRLKELFNDLWEMDSSEEAIDFLVQWCKEVDESDIAPFKKFSNTVKSHWEGIINFCETHINNGILEGINSKIQLAKRRARGYRCIENFKNMIYFLCGKLKFDYPLYSS